MKTWFKYKYLGRDCYINLGLIKWMFCDNAFVVTMRSERGEQQISLDAAEMKRLKGWLDEQGA